MEPHITGVVTEAYSLIKVCKNPFEETEVSLWLIIIWKTNRIYLSIQTWHSPLTEGPFYVYLMLRYLCYWQNHGSIKTQRIRNRHFLYKYQWWNYSRPYCLNTCAFLLCFLVCLCFFLFWTLCCYSFEN